MTVTRLERNCIRFEELSVPKVDIEVRVVRCLREFLIRGVN
jgi:hypothetical protein